MTNTDKIQANNAELRECIQIAESLPNAGGGGSSGSSKLAEVMNFEVTELTAEDLSGARTIPFNFLANQDNLEKVTFPDTLTTIYAEALAYCTDLKSVIFGKSPYLIIEDFAFQYCEKLQYIDFTACIDIPVIDEYAFDSIPTTCELRVPASRVEDYKAATNWSNYESQIVGDGDSGEVKTFTLKNFAHESADNGDNTFNFKEGKREWI